MRSSLGDVPSSQGLCLLEIARIAGTYEGCEALPVVLVQWKLACYLLDFMDDINDKTTVGREGKQKKPGF